MNFSDIIGQPLLVDRLKNIIASQRVVHSYLFTGSPGAGKKTICDIFARALLCQKKGQSPCDICQSCRQFQSGNHPDVFRVISDKKTIGVDIIREMQSDIKVKPFQGERKIYILEKADTMTPQAQNALLKTLEEPPGYAIILLLADNVAGLLPTVLSRCQRIKIPRLSPANVASILEARLEIPYDQALVFAKLSEGLPGKALKLAGSEEYQQLREDTFMFIGRLASSTLLEAMGYVSFFNERKDSIDDVLDLLELWLRDLLVCCESRNRSLLINLDKISSLESLSKTFTTEVIHGMIRNIEDSRKMIRSNANFQMVMENMLMKMRGSG